MDEFDIKIKQRLIDDIIIPEKYYIKLDNVFASLPEKNNNYEKNKMTNNKVQNSVFKEVFAVLSLVIALSGFGVYAGNKIYEKYKQENISIKNKEMKNETHPFSVEQEFLKLNMTLAENLTVKDELVAAPYTDIYYKKIYTNDEYIKMKDNITGLPDIKDEEFEKNYLLIIGYTAEEYDGLNVLDTYIENGKMIVEMGDINGNGERFSNSCATMIDKTIDAEKVCVKTIPGTELVKQFGYTPLKEITKDNFEEIKNKENWILVTLETRMYHKDLIAGEKRRIEDFINSSDNPRMMRIADIEPDLRFQNDLTKGSVKVTDLIIIDNKMMIYYVQWNKEDWNVQYDYFIKEKYKKIEKIIKEKNNYNRIIYKIDIDSWINNNDTQRQIYLTTINEEK